MEHKSQIQQQQDKTQQATQDPSLTLQCFVKSANNSRHAFNKYECKIAVTHISVCEK